MKAESEKLRSKLKRKAADTDEIFFPAALVRQQLEGVPTDILSQLPDYKNLKPSIRRARQKKRGIHVAQGRLRSYRKYLILLKTAIGERLLIYDSRDHGQPVTSRVFVLATRRNLKNFGCKFNLVFG